MANELPCLICHQRGIRLSCIHACGAPWESAFDAPTQPGMSSWQVLPTTSYQPNIFMRQTMLIGTYAKTISCSRGRLQIDCFKPCEFCHRPFVVLPCTSRQPSCALNFAWFSCPMSSRYGSPRKPSSPSQGRPRPRRRLHPMTVVLPPSFCGKLLGR